MNADLIAIALASGLSMLKPRLEGRPLLSLGVTLGAALLSHWLQASAPPPPEEQQPTAPPTAQQ